MVCSVVLFLNKLIYFLTIEEDIQRHQDDTLLKGEYINKSRLFPTTPGYI